MLIQPIEPMAVRIKFAQDIFECHLVSLSEKNLELTCTNYFEQGSQILFLGRYFRGAAIIEDIKYTMKGFKYTLFITNIKYQPGLLINTRL